jgi:hypothetical protein
MKGNMKIKDKVTWKSQSGSYWKTKIGTISEVVPAGKMPALTGSWSLSLPRNHESYIVHVPSPKFGVGKYYWPRVSGLKKAS